MLFLEDYRRDIITRTVYRLSPEHIKVNSPPH